MTLPFMLLMMFHFRNFSVGSQLYVLLHSSYGFVWVAKDLICGDKRFKQKVTFGSAVVWSALLFA